MANRKKLPGIKKRMKLQALPCLLTTNRVSKTYQFGGIIQEKK